MAPSAGVTSVTTGGVRSEVAPEAHAAGVFVDSTRLSRTTAEKSSAVSPWSKIER